MPSKPPPTSSPDRVSRARGAASAKGPEKVAGAEPVKEARRAGAVRRAERVSPNAAVAAARGVAPIQRTQRTRELVKSLAARLRHGDITVGQAVGELIDDAVQVNTRGLPGGDKLGAELRRALEDYAENDPHLLARVRRLSKLR